MNNSYKKVNANNQGKKQKEKVKIEEQKSAYGIKQTLKAGMHFNLASLVTSYILSVTSKAIA
jgi:hypothetical protein